jgi:antitoxin component YwqK of YwqJK toxin-antitoxin module
VYHPNGKKHIEGAYTNGKRTGVWRSWNENGELISEQTLP